ncbi:MAG: isoprenoid biosynthesis glyoxalase ElbB [candidate division Zixibacteria bacterium]|nr:isoprenoid biosynthesis glyoxalase ElbB [candidate division Zixibacteria bacterium]
MNNIALILSGCGIYDGSDIWEVVLISYHLEKRGQRPIFFAPNIPQKEVIDHLNQVSLSERRNVLIESARIALGQIKEIRGLSGRDVDGLILPGGNGVIKNLTDSLGEEEYLKLNPDIRRIIREVYRRKKPIGACGLASLLVASALRDILEAPLTLTVGKDPELIKQIEQLGAVHVISRGTEAVMDPEHKVVSTPGNLLKLKVIELAQATENLVSGVVDLIKLTQNRRSHA